MIKPLKQNDISELPKLDAERYENIFNVYSTAKGEEDIYYFFNILKKITIDDSNIDQNVFEYIQIDRRIPWTTVSYDTYGTQHLWWLILAVNNITNPIISPNVGDILKVVKPQYVDIILNQLR